jgi:hypothetical protein
MKDAIHHLKHVQRKVIQSLRKENNNTDTIKSQTANTVSFEHAESVSKKKFDSNHRVPRIPVRSQVH